MPVFEVYDTVVVRNDPTLIGTVERTNALPETSEIPLDDILIINHTDVSESVLLEFITTGAPPKGYVFVICLDDCKGAFLAAEEDLLLQCRSFDLGDTICRDGLLGTIIEVSDVYNLEPIWHQSVDGSISRSADVKTDHLRDCASAPANCSHSILSDIPSHELVHEQIVFEDDLICYKDWFGQVQERDIDVVMQLETGEVVLLSNPDDLHLPIPEGGKPLVSLPDFDQINRPDLLSAFQGHSAVVPMDNPKSGNFCVTSRTTLKQGRWLRGVYQSSLQPQGVVVDVIPRKLHVQWVTPNPFVCISGRDERLPPRKVSPFTNSDTYETAKDLKRRQDLTIVDFQSQADSSMTNWTRFQDGTISTLPRDFKPSSYLDLRVGDNVRFRDQAGAAVKYNNNPHGTFNRIPMNQSGDWDLNIFRVIGKRQQVAVRWQNGTTISTVSNQLSRFVGFEVDMIPTDVVIARAGLRQRKTGDESSGQEFNPFNEMASFEDMHDFYPSKVGIVQSVDATERIAQVRWLRAPRVKLLDGGIRLSPESRFGEIGDSVEELSLYELIKFPALDWRLRDTVIIPPRQLQPRVVSEITNRPHRWLSRMSEYEDIVREVRDIARQRNLLRTAPNPETPPKPHSTDWIGEIVAIALDGSVTVRLGTTKPCQDVVVQLDEILTVLRFDELEMDDSTDDMFDGLDDFLDYDSEGESASTISEHYENEAGDRIEDDDDENWVSAGEGDDEFHSPSQEETFADSQVDDTGHPTPQHELIPDQSTSGISRLMKYMPDSEPPPFAILDIDPPADQYGHASSHSSSTTFLKRIHQEHKALSSSLPKGQIFVRTYESNLSLLRCLLIGPPDTPYEHAPFLIDLHLGSKYPEEPPTAHFHSWTSGLGRINPNLYEEGKICLSLLGTWAGEQNEVWSKDATILQVLVSLHGLVMVKRPFFNEAGFEKYDKEGGYENESAQYSERAFLMARGFVKHAMFRPLIGVQDVLSWLYLSGSFLMQKVVQRSRRLIEQSENCRRANQGGTGAMDILMDGEGRVGNPTTAFLRPLSKGAVVMLRRMIDELNVQV